MWQVINKFRELNGKYHANFEDDKHNCLMHCLHMCRINRYEHTPFDLLGKWDSEAVGVIEYSNWWKDRIIFDWFGKSETHRNVLLNYNILTCCDFINNGKVWVVIRGRN